MLYPRIVPHQDGAGVIDAVGVDVLPSRVGERVWLYEAQRGRPFGTAAEYVVVPSGNAVCLPDHISFTDGACLGVPAMTAHRCLFADGPITGQGESIECNVPQAPARGEGAGAARAD